MTTRIIARTMTLAVVVLPLMASAAQISGVAINTFSSNWTSVTDLRYAHNTVNGSGTRNSYNPLDNWLNVFQPTASLTWFLNGRYTLDTIDVYNYRETTIPQARGAQNILVRYSNDYGATYSAGIPFVANASPIGPTNTPTTFALGGVTATNVKFEISSNQGGDAIGLNEIEFFGTVVGIPSGQVPITVTGYSTQFSGREAAKSVDGVYQTTDPAKMWLSAFGDNGGKPTITYSLGATPLALQHLNVWNYNEAGYAGRGLNNIQVELFNASMVSLGFAVDASDGDTTFSLGDAQGRVTADMNSLGIANDVLASYFKIITLTNPNTDSGLGGLTEVQAFVWLPEPGTAGLFAMVGIAAAARRRHQLARRPGRAAG